MLKIFRKISFVAVFWSFFYFFIFCLLLRGGFNYLDPDLGWHLRVGETISQTAQVPSQNLYNYTYTGAWVDHEWLSNYVVFKIYDNLGYPALVVSFALLIVIVLILLNLAASYLWRQKGKTPPLILISVFQLFGVVASLPHFGVRIQELALLFLVLCLIILYFYNKNKNWRYLLIFIPLFYFWACLHASFLIGLLIIFSWPAVKLLEKVIVSYNLKNKLYSKFKNKFCKYFDLADLISYRNFFIYILIAGASFLATFFTPYYIKLYSFLVGYSDTLYLSYIQEWLSQFSFPFFYWQLLYLSVTASALFIYIYFAEQKKINLWNLFIFLLFFVLSFKSRRHFPLFVVMNFIFLIEVFDDYLKIGMGKIKNFSNWLKIYLLACLFLTSLLVILGVNFIRDPFSSEAFAKDYPRDALIFISAQPEYSNFKIFNYYSWGGYMIYNNPNRKIFIDGRLPQVFYKGHSFLEEYLAFFQSAEEIEQKLKEYDIRLVLIKSKDQSTEAKKWEKFLFDVTDNELNPPNNLRNYLNNSAGWKIAYYDDSAIVYLRK